MKPFVNIGIGALTLELELELKLKLELEMLPIPYHKTSIHQIWRSIDLMWSDSTH